MTTVLFYFFLEGFFIFDQSRLLIACDETRLGKCTGIAKYNVLWRHNTTVWSALQVYIHQCVLIDQRMYSIFIYVFFSILQLPPFFFLFLAKQWLSLRLVPPPFFFLDDFDSFP